MKITKIETIRLSGSTPESRWSRIYNRMVLWVRIHTDEGYVGLGETFYGARTVETAIHEIYATSLIGKDPFQIERHWYNMFRIADHFGYGGAEIRALSALDTALWDVVGQALDRPIYELLGGACRDRIPVYDTYGGPNYFTDPVPYARELLDRGITAMKVNGFPDTHTGDGYALTRADVDRLITPMGKIADAFGGTMKMAVDGHGFWGLNAATELAQAMEQFPILWLEEMLSPRSLPAYKKFAQRTRLPICLAERFQTRYQFREFIEGGVVDVVMPDLAWTGGISETKKIAVLAETHQLPVCPHDCIGPVNVFACAHVCANIPNAMYMETSRPFYEEWYAGIVTPNITVRDGFLLVPEGPGLGTKLNPALLERPDVRVSVSDEPGPHYIGWDH